MNKLHVVLIVSVFSIAAAHSADYGFFLDPNAIASVAAVHSVPTQPIQPIVNTPPAPTQSRQLTSFPKALPATINTVMRMRHEWPRSGGTTRIDHGTGALVDGLILTARHVIEGAGTNLCEIDGAWIPCRLLAEDKDIDIAVLEPQITVQPRTYTVVDGCHSSVKGTPISVLPSKRISTLWMNIPGFHHGASGSPVIENGKVIAVAIAIRSEEEPHFVQIVPYAVWATLFDQARQLASR